MSDRIRAGMAEATRLTREGRLEEATAVIRRTLGGRFPHPRGPVPSGGERPRRR
jgi:hypothetical protein